MPKTKLQEVVFTILMVFVMVYAMICYNIALNMGGMSNIVFLNAFHELVIMGPIAFILDFFLYGSLSKKLAFRIVTPGVDKPIMLILAISSITVCLMCPTMSFFATLLFKSAGKEFIAVWFQTTALNFPMAFFWHGHCSAGICKPSAQSASAGFSGRLVLRRRVTACGLFAWQKCQEVPARHGVRLCPVGHTQGH